MAANGRLPASALRPIPGGRLARAAALRWNAMCWQLVRAGRRVPMPNGPLSTYRTFAEQVAMKLLWTRLGKPQNAATPGRSNHGLGHAVDTNDGATVDAHPEAGFDKSHSDAPWEPWHRKWDGRNGPTTGARVYMMELTTIRRGTKRSTLVRHLVVLLRGTGYLPSRRKVRGQWRPIPIRNRFGARVQIAVRQFQRHHNMRADGIVGPQTWATLRRAYDQKH